MHLVVAGDIGGAERLLADLASHPDATGAAHEVALITPNRALAAFFAARGLVVHDRGRASENALAYLCRAVGPSDVAWLTSLLRSRHVDIVHTHTFGSHVLGTRAAVRAGLPQIRTEHHVMHYFDPSCSLFTRWAARRTDRFVAISEYVRSVLAATAPAVAARAAVVRNGIDTAHFSPGPAPSGGFRLAVVCRLTGWKRVHLAVEAAALAGVELVIVGDGEQRRMLEGLALRRRANVHFVGHQADPRPFISACDATLSTSDNEPLGLSVLESLSMERPVIAFAGGGIPEIVTHGVTGMLVTEAKAPAFAAAIVRARDDRASLAAMGVAGRRFVLEYGSLEQMCSGYARAYGSLGLSA